MIVRPDDRDNSTQFLPCMHTYTQRIPLIDLHGIFNRRTTGSHRYAANRAFRSHCSTAPLYMSTMYFACKVLVKRNAAHLQSSTVNICIWLVRLWVSTMRNAS